MNKEDIELIIKKIRVAMYNHIKGMYDYDMLVDYELDYNQWKQLLGYIDELQQENNQLKEQRQELRSWLEEEKVRLARECSQIYEDSLGKTRLVNEDIFNEINKILSKLNELEGGKNE